MKKLKFIFVTLPVFFLSLFMSNITHAQSKIYEGEQLVEINKVQTLYKYIEGDAKKPLIIFIPGAAHLARISYGFPGGKEEDFLSYWWHKKGYPFLGVSYPTDNAVFSKIYPEFSIKDWGHQVATLAKNIVKTNHLSGHVVVLAWSMGGNIEESVQESLTKARLNCDQFIGLSAVTPLSYLGQKIKGFDGNRMLPNQLLDQKVFTNLFKKLIDEQGKYNNHEIISAKIYENEFIGNIPVALQGQGYFLGKNKFEFNMQKALEDSGVFNYAQTPWIGLINDDSASVPKIALVDPSGWNFIRSEMLFQQYLFYTNIESNSAKFAIAKRILSQIPQHFSDTVHGNHFFFVGKVGARDTVQKAEVLMQRMNATKQNLVKLALD
ncbi:MAG: hypothetical protein V4591_09325 [Bdellovibrionota bacterium]